MNIAELRALYNSAVTRMNDAEEAIRSAEGLEDVEARIAEANDTKAEVTRLADNIKAYESIEEARSAHQPVSLADNKTEIRVGNEPLTYEKNNGNDFFVDAIRAHFGSSEARERLSRHNEEMRAIGRVDETRAVSTSNTGGLVIPQYLTNVMVAPGKNRPFADLFQDLGTPTTQTITIPKLSGAAVAVHTENAAVQDTDPTDATEDVKVVAYAGKVTVSQEMLDLGMVGQEQLYANILRQRYDEEVDKAVVSGDVAGRYGALSASADVNAVTYTDATPTVAEVYAQIATAIAAVQAANATPDVIVMHPRRWGTFAAAVDTSGRPLIGITQGYQNALGTLDNRAPVGFVGNLMGLPVILDANIPVNLGAGTNEDAIIVADSSKLLKWESTPVVKVDDSTKLDTMSVIILLYGYLGFTVGAHSDAVSVISGTGLLV